MNTLAAPFNLAEFEATLPPAPQALASYVTAVQTGNLLYTCGVLPMQNGHVMYTGAAGNFDRSLEDVQAATRLCLINALSIVKNALGSLQSDAQIIRLTGYIKSMPKRNIMKVLKSLLKRLRDGIIFVEMIDNSILTYWR